MTNWIQHLDGTRTPYEANRKGTKTDYLLRKAVDHSRYVLVTGDGEATAWFVHADGSLTVYPWEPSREFAVLSQMVMPQCIAKRDPFWTGAYERARYFSRAMAEASIDGTLPRGWWEWPDHVFEWSTAVERHKLLDPLLKEASKPPFAAQSAA